MITSLDELQPQARAAALRYLGAATAGLPEELRDSVREDLTAHLCERLSPQATETEIDRLTAETGPVNTGANPREALAQLLERLVAGLRYRDLDHRIASTWWSPADERLLLPRAVGLGWDLNFGALAVRLRLIEPDAETEPFSATPDAAFRIAAAVPLALALATVAHYAVRGRGLPAQLPTHWSISGTPDRWTSKRRAAATDLATTVGAAVLAGWSAGNGRPGPNRAGALAGATLAATLGATTTVARSLPARRRAWLPPAMLLAVPAAVGAVLVGLARAGRAAEIHADLEESND